MPQSNYFIACKFLPMQPFFFLNLKHVPIKIGLYIKNGTPLGLSSDINSKKFPQFFILQWNTNSRCLI